jgi:hypothetical protein
MAYLAGEIAGDAFAAGVVFAGAAFAEDWFTICPMSAFTCSGSIFWKS